MTPEERAQKYAEMQVGMLPGEMGHIWEELESGRARGCFEAERRHMAPNGFLHAGAVVALADSACGYGRPSACPRGPAASPPWS